MTHPDPSDEAETSEPPPLVGKRELVVIAIRVAAAAAIGFCSKPWTLGTAAWAVAAVSVLELWAKRRGRPRYDVTLAVFVATCLAFLLAYYQALYMKAVLDGGSVAAGLDGLQGVLADAWQSGSRSFGIVVVVYAIQCIATAWTLIIFVRAHGTWSVRTLGDVALVWFLLVLLVPFVDWVLFAAIQHELDARVVGLSLISAILLAVGSLMALVALLSGFTLADLLRDALVPPEDISLARRDFRQGQKAPEEQPECYKDSPSNQGEVRG